MLGGPDGVAWLGMRIQTACCGGGARGVCLQCVMHVPLSCATNPSLLGCPPTLALAHTDFHPLLSLGWHWLSALRPFCAG